MARQTSWVIAFGYFKMRRIYILCSYRAYIPDLPTLTHFAWFSRISLSNHAITHFFSNLTQYHNFSRKFLNFSRNYICSNPWPNFQMWIGEGASSLLKKWEVHLPFLVAPTLIAIGTFKQNFSHLTQKEFKTFSYYRGRFKVYFSHLR